MLKSKSLPRCKNSHLIVLACLITVVPLAFAGGAGAVLADVTNESDRVITSGETVYQGQEVAVNVTDFTDQDNVALRTVDQEDDTIGSLVSQPAINDYGTEQYAIVDTQNREEGQYVLTSDSFGESIDGNDVRFEVIEMDLSVEIDGEKTYNTNVDKLTGLEVQSNLRNTYAISVSADGLSDEELEKIFNTDGQLGTENTTIDNQYAAASKAGSSGYAMFDGDDEALTIFDGEQVFDLNFTGIESDIYKIDIEVIDTSATDSVIVEHNIPERTYSFDIPNDGEMHSVGVPGEINGTLADMIDPTQAGYTVFVFSEGSWEAATDFESVELSGLDAIVIATEGETNQPNKFTLEMQFDSNLIPPEKQLTEGWNYVSAPKFANADVVFDINSAFVVVDPFESANSNQVQSVNQFGSHYVGSDSNEVSPFKGYFIFVEDDTTLPGVLSGVDTQSDIVDQLDIDSTE